MYSKKDINVKVTQNAEFFCKKCGAELAGDEDYCPGYDVKLIWHEEQEA